MSSIVAAIRASLPAPSFAFHCSKRRYLASLASLRSIEITELLRECGLPVSGTKSEKIERLKARLRKLRDLGMLRSSHNEAQATSPRSEDEALRRAIVPEQVVSIDIGFRNMAVVHLSRDREILDWKRVELLPEARFEPWDLAKRVHSFCAEHLPRVPVHLGTYIIEHQRFRTQGSSAVANAVMINNIIEALIYANLGQFDVEVEAINPATVSTYFGFPAAGSTALRNKKGESAGGARNLTKKRAATVIVKSWLEPWTNGDDSSVRDTTRDPPPSASSSASAVPLMPLKADVKWAAFLKSERKKDDLSDSLLQAMAWLDWQTNAINAVKQYMDPIDIKHMVGDA
ncbi:hypothetical protein EV182_002550 [Spiromyces aspiralis]|uniref:Uncharacterized protein n=1 Tax=Spiromyces aspiralis TaxID=68401 RepID=A0ACC1HGC7_9FUNG|nr:hypothetical protein EV182_002550 [Spiromyces aspiralis]